MSISNRFDWREYLNVAKELADIHERVSLPDAKLRSSISRAYYAAFNLAYQSLPSETQEEFRRAADKHVRVIDQFGVSQDRLRMTIFVNLRRLRFDRNNADYAPENSTVAALQSTAEMDIGLADEVIRILRLL